MQSEYASLILGCCLNKIKICGHICILLNVGRAKGLEFRGVGACVDCVLRAMYHLVAAPGT
jgi:hypothetical protein